MKKLTAAILLLCQISLPLALQADTISKKAGQFDYYTLALSWQAAFCESKPRKPECQSQNDKQFSAYHFVLHGLWPNVKGDKHHQYGYCDVPKHIVKKDKNRRWCNTPRLNLSDEERERLSKFMPGSVSCLQRHEWYKHGSCSGLSENDYFALSNRLVKMFSETRFSQYVKDNVGKYVKRNSLLKMFDKEFGKGSRAYLALRCKKVRGTSLLTEIQIHLKKNLSISNMSDFRNLFPEEKIKIYGTCQHRFKIDEVGVAN